MAIIFYFRPSPAVAARLVSAAWSTYQFVRGRWFETDGRASALHDSRAVNALDNTELTLSAGVN
jgi:hypothetical protein